MDMILPRSQISPSLSYDDYLRFRELVLEWSGLYFPETKRFDLESGLLKALAGSVAGHSNGNLDSYYQLLCDKSNPVGRAEMERLINLLTVGETYFFRDEGQFDALTTQVLPTLITRKRAEATAAGPHVHPQLRLWSAGCATGEEAYSLAIILKELLSDIDRWRILILATDINRDALARAREAAYSDWSFREVRAKAIQSRYFNFDATTNRYILDDDIRRMVTFTPLNLAQDDYPAPHNNTLGMDLILCRNVTIYFTEDNTRRIAQRFYETLTQDGWLVVGHSEPSSMVYSAFQPHIWSNALFYQKTGQPHFEPDNWVWLQPTPTFDGNLGHGPNNGSSTAPSPSTPTSSYSSFEAGYSSERVAIFLSQDRTTEAIDELQRQLSIDPHFAPVHTLLGRVYANLGRWSEAKYWCQSAIELDKLQAEAYYLLGLVYEHEEQLEMAVAMLKKAIYLEPNAPLPHLNLVALYRQTGQIKNARRTCRNAIKVLEKYPPAEVIPHSGGAIAKHLLAAARRILGGLEN